MKQYVAPLPLKEQISAYDYNGNLDSIFVATNDCLAIYNVEELRKPKTLFSFDHFHEVTRIRAQHAQNPLVSTVDTCAVNLWDVEKNSKPLIDILSFKTRIQDFRWNRHSSSTFMMGTADGLVSTWDVRAGTKCVSQFSVGRKLLQSLKLCPNNSNLGALLADNKFIVVWDTRMSANQSKGIVSDNLHDFYQVIEVEEGIADFHWHWCQPSIWTITSKGKVDLTKIESTDAHLTQNREKIEKRAIGNPAAVCWAINPHPDGHGAIVQQRDTTKNLSVINYINFKNQSSSEEYEIAKSSNKLFVCSWRGSYTNPTSMVALSTTGLLHLFDWNPPKKTASNDQLTAFGSTTSLSSTKSVTVARNKYSWDEMKPTIGTDDMETPVPRLSEMHTDIDKSRLIVVGPKSFAALLSDEITLLQKARRLGKIDGIRVESMDHFQRQLVLEILVPTTDPFSIAAKRVAFYATNYYKSEELRVFYKGGAQQTVALVLSFHHKMNKFWQPKFTIENRSEFKFEMQTLSKYIIDGLEEVLKLLPSHYLNAGNNTAPTGNSNNNNNTGKYNSPQGNNGTEYSTSFIYLIAKCFRKRVLKSWSRLCDTGNFNDSIRRSLQPEKAQLTDSENEVHKQSAAENGDGDGEGNEAGGGGEYLDLSTLAVTDPYVKLALRTPFPALSMGIFNSRGELVLLGNAEISYATEKKFNEEEKLPLAATTTTATTNMTPSTPQPKQQQQKDTITTIQADCYYVSGIAKSVYNPSYAQKRTLAEAKIAYRQPHISYANLMMNRLSAVMMKPTISEGKISTMSSNSVLDNANNMHHSLSNSKFLISPGSSHHGSHHGSSHHGGHTVSPSIQHVSSSMSTHHRLPDDDYQVTFEETNDYHTPTTLHHTKTVNIGRQLNTNTNMNTNMNMNLPSRNSSHHGTISHSGSGGGGGSGGYGFHGHTNAPIAHSTNAHHHQEDVLYWEDSNHSLPHHHHPHHPTTATTTTTTGTKVRADSYFSEVSNATTRTSSVLPHHPSSEYMSSNNSNTHHTTSAGFTGPSSFLSTHSYMSHIPHIPSHTPHTSSQHHPRNHPHHAQPSHSNGYGNGNNGDDRDGLTGTHHTLDYHDYHDHPDGTTTTTTAFYPTSHIPNKILSHIKLCQTFPLLEYQLALTLQLGPLISTFPDTAAAYASPHSEYLQTRILACQQNASLFQHYAPTDYGLIQCWNLLAVSLEVHAVIDNGGLISWNNSVLGKSLFNQLMLYFVQIQNIQLLATVICILGDSRSVVRLWSTPHIPFLTRDDNPEDTIENTVLYFEQVLYTYADILRRWGEMAKATEVTKHMSLKGILEKKRFDISSARNSTISFAVACMVCGNKTSDGGGNVTNTSHMMMTNKFFTSSNTTANATSSSSSYHRCHTCQRYANYCTVCIQPVRRMISICDRCGHGGHEEHLVHWFAKHAQCPTGCGCRCRSQQSMMTNEEYILFEDPTDTIMSMYPVAKKQPSLYQDVVPPPLPYFSNYLEEISLGNNFLSAYNYNNFYDTS